MTAGSDIRLIAQRIRLVRGQKILLDADLAALYGAETRRLNEQVRRNPERFPADFMFRLTSQELSDLKSQIATSSWGGSRKPPCAFTEHGALMAAAVLNSPRAVEMSLYVVRAFIRLREMLSSHRELAQKLAELERKTEALALKHDILEHAARTQLKQLFDAIRELMAPPAPVKRPIGFVELEDKSKK